MPKADIFAGKGSFAAKIKARREAMDVGELEAMPEAFKRGEWKDLSVDEVTGNRKETYSDVDEKRELRDKDS